MQSLVLHKSFSILARQYYDIFMKRKNTETYETKSKKMECKKKQKRGRYTGFDNLVDTLLFYSE